MKKAILNAGTVVFAGYIEPGSQMGVGAVDCPDNVQSGWALVDGVWTPPVPVSITMRQARLALLAAGLLDDIDMAIAAMPEPQRTAARIEWEYAATVDRDAAWVSKIAAGLGLTDEQMDALFAAGGVL